MQFFEELGMLMHEKNGGVYPYTDQAQTVQMLFLDVLRERGVKIKTIRGRCCDSCLRIKGSTDTWRV